MPYFSLYRRWRPLTFKEMMGQEHITRTLSNALVAERLAHAYLLCGPRGTGKTTAAKILARAMNCEKYPVSEPCGKCSSCKNIAAGASLDVIEMDAASNRGIDEIRELRERSRFASGEGRFKVYIIDEAHMLTPEACNAFLKTLEEPPQNVVFILATTDPSRLPSTIVSRCQRFDFHLLTVKLIRQRLDYILKEEGWEAEKEALDMIARLADGSLRDALGILEQCSAYGQEKITAEQVRVVTGATRVDVIEKLLKAALENDLKSGLSVVEQIIFSGRDLNLFMRDFTFVFTRLLLNSAQDGDSEDLHGFEEVIEEHRGKIEQHLLLDAVELLHEVSSDLRNAHFPRYILEVAFIRLLRVLHGRLKPVSIWKTIRSEEEVPVVSTSEQLPVVDQTDKDAAGKDEPGRNDSRDDDQARESSSQEIPVETGEKQNEGPEKCSEQVVESWPAIIDEIKKRQKTTAAWLEPALIAEVKGNLVRLNYAQEYEIHKLRIMEDHHRKLVESVLTDFCGQPINIKAETGDTSIRGAGNSMPVEEMAAGSKTREEKGKEEKPEENKKSTVSAEDAIELFGGKIIEED